MKVAKILIKIFVLYVTASIVGFILFGCKTTKEPKKDPRGVFEYCPQDDTCKILFKWNYPPDDENVK